MVIEVDKVCRICLKGSNDLRTVSSSSEKLFLQPLFEYEYENTKILDILIKVCYDIFRSPQKNDENWPNKLCCDCIEVLCAAHRLNQTCIDTDRKLIALIEPSGIFVKEEIDLDVKLEVNLDEEDESLQGKLGENFQETEEYIDESSDEKEDVKKIKRYQCPTCLKAFEVSSFIRFNYRRNHKLLLTETFEAQATRSDS